MADKSERLSNYDVNSPIDSDRVEVRISDLNVSDDRLFVVKSDGMGVDLGRWSISSGKGFLSANLEVDGRLMQTTTDGSTSTVGRVIRDRTTRIELVGSGLYVGETSSEENRLIPLNPNVEWSSPSGNDIVVVGGTRINGGAIPTGGSYNNVIRLLNDSVESNVDGIRFAAGAVESLRWIQAVFVEDVVFSGIMLQNCDAANATLSGVVEVFSSDEWRMVDVFDFTNAILDPLIVEFVEYRMGEAIRIRATSISGTGGLGIFKPLTITEYKITRQYKPILFDQARFAVNETPNEIQISVIPSSGSGVSAASPLDYDAHFHAVRTMGLGDQYPTFGTGTSLRPVVLDTVKINTLNVISRCGYFLLDPGRYVCRFAVIETSGTPEAIYLVNARTFWPIVNPYLRVSDNNNGTFGAVSGEFEFYLVEQTAVTFATLPESSSLPYPNNPTTLPIETANILLWKVSDVPSIIHRYSALPPKPIGVNEADINVIRWGAIGNGKALVDLQAIDTITGIDAATWSASSHYAIVSFDRNVRLWRLGAAVTGPNNTAPLGITKVDGIEINFSSSHLNIVAADPSVWTRFTEVLPAGTYRFDRLSGTRSDTEWFAEIVTS